MKDFLRRFKISYILYNFFRKKDLQHNEAMYNKLGIKKKYFSPVNSKDFENLPQETPWLDKEDSKVVLPNNQQFQALPTNIQNELINYSDKGYAILRGFFDAQTIGKINTEIDSMVAEGKANWRYNNSKIMFAIHESTFLKSIGKNEQLNTILSLLLGKKSKLFQSINFLYGSEQKTHSDSVHMTTYPFGYMIAVWVALEDISEDQGPLHYYPGSHKLPYVMNKDYNNEGNQFLVGDKLYYDYEDKIEEIIKDKNLQKETFLAKKGDVLIWHANLMHGGNKHVDKSKTRKSMVFHYFSENVVSYHEFTQRPALIKE